MRVKKKNNSGFTLVELIVALAIMAILMTAVCALMGQNSVTYKKTKADIYVQNSAQATYDSIADSIMQAKSIEIEGYIIGAIGVANTDADTIAFSSVDIGADSSLTPKAVKCIRISQVPAGENEADYTDFSLLKPATGGYTNLYIKKMVIKYSVPLDTDSSQKDTCTVTYYFDGKNMYVGRTYDVMTSKNDMWANDGDDKTQWLYSSSLNYVNCNGTTVSGIIAQVDAENESIGLDIRFADKSMSYTTNGMIRTRNSYVLKDPKVKGE